MAPSLAGRVAVVTGGSAGVGRAVVRALAAEGVSVAILARGQDGLDGAVRDVQRAGQRALGISVDVSDAAAVDAAAQRVEDELGPIDLWVNDAMASVFAPFVDVEPAEFERATAVTYFGVVNGTRAALRHMRRRNRGHVIQIGSALAYRGIPLQSAYCGAKHAVVGFTESVIGELRHDRSDVRLSMVQLPAVNTPQFGWVLSKLPHHPQPVPPIYQPEAAATAVVFVAGHPHRRNFWLGLPTAATILGNRFAPKVEDAYLGRTGYDGQQDESKDDLPVVSNLDAPVPGDRGAHGDFDEQARSGRADLFVATHRAALLGGAAAVLAGAGTAVLRRR